MSVQESGYPMGGEDGVKRRPILGVGLEHVFDQIVQLIGQVIGQGRVSPPTHLQDEAPPAECLELRHETAKLKRIPGNTNPTATAGTNKYTADN